MIPEDLIKRVATKVTQRVGTIANDPAPTASRDNLESATQQLREIQAAVDEVKRTLNSLATRQRSTSLPIIDQSIEHEHPSRELFNVPEEVTEFVDYLETKQCVLEPGKPCIGRGECRSRGF